MQKKDPEDCPAFPAVHVSAKRTDVSSFPQQGNILTVVSHLILVKELENATSVLVEVLGSSKITTFSDTKITRLFHQLYLGPLTDTGT